jgi:uncharacterized protein (TIGR02001 family)
MIKSRVLLAGALLVAAGAANAGVTVTPAVVSDYDFRGISQSAKDPALQLGVNYTHESGFYAGLWGSNVDFGPGDPNVEVDAFAGFTGGDAQQSFGWDVGAVYYTYVSESDFNYPEIYAGVSKGPISAKLYYSWDFAGTSTDAFYLTADGTFPIGDTGFAALAHLGYNFGDFWDEAYGDGYIDWAVGVQKAFGNFTVALKYIDGSDLPDGRSDIFSTDAKVWASISTTLPWASN